MKFSIFDCELKKYFYETVKLIIILKIIYKKINYK